VAAGWGQPLNGGNRIFAPNSHPIPTSAQLSADTRLGTALNHRHKPPQLRQAMTRDEVHPILTLGGFPKANAAAIRRQQGIGVYSENSASYRNSESRAACIMWGLR
jgi:hypothetical protein